MARRIAQPASLAALVALAAVLAEAALPARAPAGSGATVRPEVRAVLARESTAAVLIALREPGALRVSSIDVARLRREVAAAQASVLAVVPPSELELTYRYRAVPALAGRISAAGLAALVARPEVLEVALDGQGSAALVQSAPLVHAVEVQAAGLTGEGVVVAVLDSGIDTDHPDLSGDILYEVCLLGAACPAGDHPAEDDHGHGTNVSGIITGDGTIAPRGVAPDAQIAAYKVLNAANQGTVSDWIAALDDIIAGHPEVDVVNMSLQSTFACPAGPMGTAVATLRKRGVATVIAAGNHGTKNSLTVPACIDEGLSVGAVYDASLGTVNGWKSACSDATTAADQVACWSDSDGSLDLLGPGAFITSTGATGGTSTFFGTSQAAPHVAGIAALVLQASPDLTVDQLETRLEATGTLLSDDLDDGDPTTNRATPRVDARVALLDDSEDSDGDGCANHEEYGADPGLGGRRNPLNPWDFYDVTGDRTVNTADVLAVVGGYGPSSGEQYDPDLDRSRPPAGAQPWHLGRPDGVINVADDILGVLAQYGHTCQGP